MQLAKAALVSTTRDGATIQPPLASEDTKEVHGGLSCEIVSDLCPNPFSHDWHVQPSCQRPNRIPPERRVFDQSGLTQVRVRLSSKPLQPYRAPPIASTRASHRISTRFPQGESSDREADCNPNRFCSMQQYGLPPESYKCRCSGARAF